MGTQLHGLFHKETAAHGLAEGQRHDGAGFRRGRHLFFLQDKAGLLFGCFGDGETAAAALAVKQQDLLARGQAQHLDQMLGFLAFQPEIVGPLFGRKIKAVQTHDALDPFAVRARRTALKPSCSETRRP